MACVVALKSISVPMRVIRIRKIDLHCFEKRIVSQSLMEHEGEEVAKRMKPYVPCKCELRRLHVNCGAAIRARWI